MCRLVAYLNAAERSGSISAEHGVGLMKARSLLKRKDPALLATMASIKGALDPQGILNPYKVLVSE